MCEKEKVNEATGVVNERGRKRCVRVRAGE